MAKSARKKSNSETVTEFICARWEKSACVAKAPPSITEISAEDIFMLLLRYCNQARASDSMSGLKFYVGGIQLEPFEALEHLPTADDQNFAGYHRRMIRSFKDYGLVCDELYSVMNGDLVHIRDSIWKFTDALFNRVGLPNQFAEIGLYLGNYRKTPFGVHVDQCGVLSLPVVGKKNFRIWKADVVAENPELKESFSYDEFKKQSVLLKVHPGDMAYWPSSDWHIAESDGKFSVTWSIGVWTNKRTDAVVIEALSELLHQKLTQALKRSGKKTALKYSASLPAELDRAADALSKLSKREIKDALRKWWSDHYHSNGFKS